MDENQTMPAPMVSPEVDLRGLEWMPLFGDRLFASQTWITATAEAKIAALRLWWHAYAHEVPAASLPDDDALLADYAGYGVLIKVWLKIKPAALRGWVKCSDGRLYHSVVADLANEAWKMRERNRAKQKRWRDRNPSHNHEGDGNETVTDGLTKGVTKPSRYAGQDRTGQDRTKESKKPPEESGPGSGRAEGFSGKAIRLTAAQMAQCREVYPLADLTARLTVYDVKFIEKGDPIPVALSRVLAWLSRDAPRQKAVEESAAKAPPRAPLAEIGGETVAAYDSPWPQRMAGWRKSKFWIPDWGPRPGEPDCRVPKELLKNGA